MNEIIMRATPSDNDKLHLIDGSLLTATDYASFVQFIAGLYATDPTAYYFTTEADWQTENTANGCCDKYVYDSENNTVRIPNYGNYLGTVSSGAMLRVYFYLKVKS